LDAIAASISAGVNPARSFVVSVIPFVSRSSPQAVSMLLLLLVLFVSSVLFPVAPSARGGAP